MQSACESVLGHVNTYRESSESQQKTCLEGCTAALNFWCILSEGWHIILPYSRNLIFENETVECNFRCIYIPLKMRCHRAAEEIVKNCDVCAKETKCDL